MMYFFELGNNPALSIAEIAAVFGMNEKYRLIGGKILIIEDCLEFNATTLIKKMGGIIKIGVLDEKKVKNIDIKNCLPILEKLINIKSEKICFGISSYGRKKINLKYLGMDIKTYIKERGGNCRWVSSRENILSSVVVEQNGLLKKGFELIILEDGKDFYLGRTLAVQPFKELSWRDYGRPARDDKSGMLPPKLAQVMINIASAKLCDKYNKKIYDPFCGSGTVITEAALMGYQNIFGSDLSSKAVSDTKQNIEWIIRHNKEVIDCQNLKFDIKQIDVKKLGVNIGRQAIDMVATEPYLGPQQGLSNIALIKKELEILYKDTLKQLGLVLKKNGRIVFVFPVFNQNHKMHFLNVDLSGFKIINPLPQSVSNEKILKISFRKTIVYGREGQRVWREIVILENNF